MDSEERSSIAADGLLYPNGTALSPDGKRLLIGKTLGTRILEFSFEGPGTLGAREIFAQIPSVFFRSDGMAFDTDGNLHVASYPTDEVGVFDPEGQMLGSFPGGGMFTSNVEFAGKEMKQLYVTGSIGPTQQTTGLLVRIDLAWITGFRVLPERK